jgi:hypothetical protein
MAEADGQTSFFVSDSLSRLARFRGLVGRNWVLLALVAVGFATSTTVTLLHSEALSPLDEWVYVDYVEKVPDQGMVFKGEPIGDEALDLIACHGVTPYGKMGDPCGSDYEYAHFPFGGITSADPYPPVFFAITRVVGDGISFVTGVNELTGWRLTGPLWLVGTLIAFWALMRAWRVDRFAILGLGLAFVGSPLAYWSYSYVSTDAPAFLVGAILLYLSTRYLRGETSGRWIVAVAGIAALFKITNLLGIGMIALVLIFAAVMRARASDLSFRGAPVRAIGVAALALIVGIAVQAGWLLVTRLTAVSTEIANQASVAQPLTIQELLGQVVNFLPGTLASNVPVAGGTGFVLPFPGWATVPLSWICIAGVVGALLRMATLRGDRSAVILGVGVAAALAGPALALAMQIFLSSYFPLPPRYGASLLPGFLLLAGMLLRNRVISFAIGGYGVALCGALVYGAYLLGRA